MTHQAGPLPMKPFQIQHKTITVGTRGKGTIEITDQVREILRASGITEGVVTVFVRHTSCSLVIMENADPSARRDLHEFFERLVPEDTPWFQHTCEGPDDMPSHLRMAPNGVPHKHEYLSITEGRSRRGFPENVWDGAGPIHLAIG